LAIVARDAAIPTQTTAEPIATIIFESGAAAPAPTPAPAPVPTSAPAASPVPTTATDPSTAATTGATTVVKAVIVEQHDTEQREGKGLEMEGVETQAEKRSREENDEIEQSEEKRRENKRETDGRINEEVRTQTAGDSLPRHHLTPFDWATDVDESAGLSPVTSTDTTTLVGLTDTITIAPILVDHPLVSTEPTPITSNKPIPEAHVNAFGDPTPDTIVNTTPDVLVDTTPITCIDSTPATPVTPTLPTVHGPRDLSALRSGTANPWGSIKHRRHHSDPPRDLTALRSSTSNPWGSLHHRRRRSYPLPTNHTQSNPKRGDLRSPHTRDTRLHLELSTLNKSLHLRSSPEPVHIIQTIQHPRGILPTKPKIIKNIPTALRVDTPVPCCTCGNIAPVYSLDRGSWRSMDTLRFRRGFSRRFRSRRFWDRERGRSHLWGGHMW
jgi:hypothetical protein